MKLDLAGVTSYAAEIRRIRSDPDHNPETSLYGPLEALLAGAAEEIRPKTRVVAQHRTRQAGVPDFALLDVYGHPFAYVEAKEPGKRLDGLSGADKAQFERYRELPCVLYTNFFDVALFENGEQVGKARLLDPSSLDPAERRPPPPGDLAEARGLLERLLSFAPESPRSAREVADALARRARLVKEVALEVVSERGDSPLHDLHRELESVLFGDLGVERFADTYAQTLTYGLLLARLLRPDAELTLATAPAALGGDHKLLSAALRLLGFPEVTERIGWSVEALLATANLVDPAVLSRGGEEDPTIYFYEEFLGAYDPGLRKAVGVYYTPLEVVRFQVRAIEALLRDQLGIEGYTDENLHILDPATGTGTYLLGIFEHVREAARLELGAAATRGVLRELAARAYAFELLIGPYAVARWRLTTMLREEGIAESPHVVLADTLAEPREGKHVVGRFGFIDGPLTEERNEAERIKTKQPIQVILGNPPYERTRLRAGEGAEGAGDRWEWIWKKVDDFKDGVPDEERVNLKNLADRYVLFYRWAFWKLFEADPDGPGRGVVSFISNRSFLTGGAFSGMRAFMRKRFQRIAIVDLGGDVRAAKLGGAPPDEPLFDIQTGTAIAVCIATGEPGGCKVDYRRLEGTRAEKLAALRKATVRSGFERVEGEGGDSFVPRGVETFHAWPSLETLFAEKFSGVQTKRDQLVVAVRSEELRRNLAALEAAVPEKARELFHETRDKKLPERAQLRWDPDYVIRYGYRPLDRRYLYGNDHLVEYSRANSLQPCWGEVGRPHDAATRAWQRAGGVPPGRATGPLLLPRQLQQPSLSSLERARDAGTGSRPQLPASADWSARGGLRRGQPGIRLRLRVRRPSSAVVHSPLSRGASAELPARSVSQGEAALRERGGEGGGAGVPPRVRPAGAARGESIEARGRGRRHRRDLVRRGAGARGARSVDGADRGDAGDVGIRGQRLPRAAALARSAQGPRAHARRDQGALGRRLCHPPDGRPRTEARRGARADPDEATARPVATRLGVKAEGIPAIVVGPSWVEIAPPAAPASGGNSGGGTSSGKKPVRRLRVA